jgi:AcrR family transcriptional regulator
MNRIVFAPRSRVPISPSHRADSKARTRQKVLEAARDLFMERGYDAATIRDIAARAGLSTGAVFASFSDKADLFNTVLAQDTERQSDLVKTPASEIPTEAALMELFRRAYGFHMEQLPLLQAATGLSWSQGLGGPLGNRPVYSLALAAMSAILTRAIERGELPASMDEALLSEMLWDAYLSNYRQALFDGWGLEQLVNRLERQVHVLLAGAGASAPPT